MSSRLTDPTDSAAKTASPMALLVILLIVAGAGSVPAAAQGDPAAAAPPTAEQGDATAPAPPAADSDPVEPIVLQTRDEYTHLPDGAWVNAFILRRDQLILKNRGVKRGKKGLLLRFDLPMVSVHSGTDTDTGLGDLYAQAAFFPRMTRTFALGGGTGLYLPTASLDATGSGKWTVAPLVVPIWFFPKAGAFAYIKAQNVTSLGGASDRPDINYFVLTPTGVWKAGRKRWVLVDSEARRDWENDLWSYKSGLQYGTRFGNGKGAWIKVEIPWGPNQQSDWTIKTSFYRVR